MKYIVNIVIAVIAIFVITACKNYPIEKEFIYVNVPVHVKDTIAENTKINIEKISVAIKCNECSYEGNLGKNNYVCPSCKGNKYEIIKGREFYLDTMEVE